jgi:sugar phosphate isomerase/epimerase
MRWLERLSPHLAGMHLHDVSRIGHDHLMPPVGDMDFTMLKSFLRENMPLVLEPAPGMPVEMVEEGIQIISEAFNLPQAG